MSERTVRVNGVCLSESQVRQAYAELEHGDAAAIASQVCVTSSGGALYLSVPTDSVRVVVELAREDQRVLLVRLHTGNCSGAWFACNARHTEGRLVLTWPEIVRRLTEGAR